MTTSESFRLLLALNTCQGTMLDIDTLISNAGEVCALYDILCQGKDVGAPDLPEDLSEYDLARMEGVLVGLLAAISLLQGSAPVEVLSNLGGRVGSQLVDWFTAFEDEDEEDDEPLSLRDALNASIAMTEDGLDPADCQDVDDEDDDEDDEYEVDLNQDGSLNSLWYDRAVAWAKDLPPKGKYGLDAPTAQAILALFADRM